MRPYIFFNNKSKMVIENNLRKYFRTHCSVVATYSFGLIKINICSTRKSGTQNIGTSCIHKRRRRPFFFFHS